MKNKTLNDLYKMIKNINYVGASPNFDGLVLLEKREKDILAVATNGKILITRLIDDERLFNWVEGEIVISPIKVFLSRKDLRGDVPNCEFFEDKIMTNHGMILKKMVQFPAWRKSINFSVQSVDKVAMNNDIFMQALKTVKDLGYRFTEISFTHAGFVKINYSDNQDEFIVVCPMKSGK